MAILPWVFKLGAWFFLHLVAPLQVFQIYSGFSAKPQGDLLANRQKWLFCAIFHKKSKFWELLRGLTELYGSFIVLKVWGLWLRSYITAMTLIGSLVAMVTRSKLVIFCVFQRHNYLKATRALRLSIAHPYQWYRCLGHKIWQYKCFQNFWISSQNFPLAALKLGDRYDPDREIVTSLRLLFMCTFRQSQR